MVWQGRGYVSLMTFPSKRSGINLNFWPEPDSLVDAFRGSNSLGPFSTSWATGAMWNADHVDETTGLPNTADGRTRRFGGFVVYCVSSDDFTGKRVLTWSGDGEGTFSAGTWTVDAGLSSNYTEVSNGRYTGTNPRIVLTYTGASAGIGWSFIQHDRSSTGDYITEAHCYRLEDEDRFLAGKCFRTGYLQNYVTLNPGYIRFMNTAQINTSLECRYEHHNTSTRQAWAGTNHLACDTYGEITGTNTYAIADSAGSPAAMQHGEKVVGRVTNATVRGLVSTMTGVTKANPGVAHVVGHGYNTGDIIIHRMAATMLGAAAGMTQLDLVPCTITVDDADHYQLGIDTSAFSDFTVGFSNQYTTLNRGGLGAYPIVFEEGLVPSSHYSTSGYIAAGDYKTFTFDKYCVASTAVTGAWIFSNLGASPGSKGAAPEIMAQFMVELDEMQVEQGLGPTDMWICIPPYGLLSVDPDYTLASHYGIGFVDDVLNGANGYSGIPSRCSLIVEFGNELWNTAGGTAFWQSLYMARLGFLRWGGSVSDYATYATLRAVILVNDLKTAFPAHAQLKYVQCGQGTLGVAGINATRINGNATYDGDAWNTWGGNPIDHFDGFAWASYFLAGSTFDTANLTTLAANYAAAGTDAAREAACSTYVDGVLGSAASGETINRYLNTLLPAYCDEMVTHGKIALQYEGGWDRAISGTAEVQTFLTAVKKSTAWAVATRYYFDGWLEQSGNANVETTAYYPADYIMIDARWGHCTPDTYLNGVEGGRLDLAWAQIADYNNTISPPDPEPEVPDNAGHDGVGKKPKRKHKPEARQEYPEDDDRPAKKPQHEVIREKYVKDRNSLLSLLKRLFGLADDEPKVAQMQFLAEAPAAKPVSPALMNFLKTGVLPIAEMKAKVPEAVDTKAFDDVVAEYDRMREQMLKDDEEIAFVVAMMR